MGDGGAGRQWERERMGAGRGVHTVNGPLGKVKTYCTNNMMVASASFMPIIVSLVPRLSTIKRFLYSTRNWVHTQAIGTVGTFNLIDKARQRGDVTVFGPERQ